MSSAVCRVAGFECDLAEDSEPYTSEDGKTWLIDDEVLKRIANDLQKIVNCAKENDVLTFDVTDVIQPASSVTIHRQLTLRTRANGADSGGDVFDRPTKKTKFKCPQKNSALFIIQ